jgi:NAD(P)-dependent dehydrogenase (short-subunit alcohol dehydrogenase family)
MPKDAKSFIVLSGVTRGLGRSMADELVARGHKLAGCGRSEKIRELKKQYPAHHWEQIDVTNEKQVKSWAEQILDEFGPPDLLINNAALINDPAPLWEIKPAEFSEIIDVNIKGVYHMIRNFVPSMVSRNHGVIVNLSSGWGRSTSPEVAPYCATKFAIEGLTQALAQELPSEMAAVPLNPGIIDTQMLRSSFGASASSYPKPEAWAKNAVPFILSLSARHNGQSLTVPGSSGD